VLDDLYNESRGVDLKKGEDVTLNGQEAYCYLRGRDVNDFDSATERLRRQEQYISSLLLGLKGREDSETAVLNMYAAIGDYTVTDTDVTSLLDTLLGYEYTEDDMYTVPGETSTNEYGYEEYNVDQDAFYDLVIRLFYEEVEGN
jgi:anionic cell wall polymer biosynthesis LytR-Cps2A-Psr (LCP) family protein